ncbi:MAG TPA: phosphotransferase [Candidatus Bathyarchaeia archaeon]|nr:phosphotransferase [Candidatus Bathyarchaeia archaeon]
MDSRSMRKTIEKCFPGFRVRRSRQILSGWDNVVLEVNGDYIFRFPRFRESEKNLRKEIRLLPVLSKYLTTRVPKYEFVWKGNRDYSHWFAGYGE